MKIQQLTAVLLSALLLLGGMTACKQSVPGNAQKPESGAKEQVLSAREKQSQAESEFLQEQPRAAAPVETASLKVTQKTSVRTVTETVRETIPAAKYTAVGQKFTGATKKVTWINVWYASTEQWFKPWTASGAHFFVDGQWTGMDWDSEVFARKVLQEIKASGVSAVVFDCTNGMHDFVIARLQPTARNTGWNTVLPSAMPIITVLTSGPN